MVLLTLNGQVCGNLILCFKNLGFIVYTNIHGKKLYLDSMAYIIQVLQFQYYLYQKTKTIFMTNSFWLFTLCQNIFSCSNCFLEGYDLINIKNLERKLDQWCKKMRKNRHSKEIGSSFWKLLLSDYLLINYY